MDTDVHLNSNSGRLYLCLKKPVRKTVLPCKFMMIEWMTAQKHSSNFFSVIELDDQTPWQAIRQSWGWNFHSNRKIAEERIGRSSILSLHYLSESDNAFQSSHRFFRWYIKVLRSVMF